MENINKKVITHLYFYSIPANVLDALNEGAEYYNYHLSFESSKIKEDSLNNKKTTIYEGLDGLIECITQWKNRFEESYNELAQVNKDDAEKLQSLDWFEANQLTLEDFLTELE